MVERIVDATSEPSLRTAVGDLAAGDAVMLWLRAPALEALQRAVPVRSMPSEENARVQIEDLSRYVRHARNMHEEGRDVGRRVAGAHAQQGAVIGRAGDVEGYYLGMPDFASLDSLLKRELSKASPGQAFVKPAQPPASTMMRRPSAGAVARERAVLTAATALSVSWIIGNPSCSNDLHRGIRKPRAKRRSR